MLAEVLGAGRHELPGPRLFGRTPKVDVVLVDMRNRDLTIKGQEILTADKVAIRVSILVQFAVIVRRLPCTRSKTARTGCTRMSRWRCSNRRVILLGRSGRIACVLSLLFRGFRS